jgi:transcriptional regulator GlxA family with amidase domain
MQNAKYFLSFKDNERLHCTIVLNFRQEHEDFVSSNQSGLCRNYFNNLSKRCYSRYACRVACGFEKRTSVLADNFRKSRFTFAFVLLDKFNMLSLSALVEPLRIANYCSGRDLYGWRYLSADGSDISSSTGLMIPTQAVSMNDTEWDAIIVCGGWNAERYDRPELLGWLLRQGRSGVILGATETGTYVLARAGLLHGVPATIHWHCHNAFRERFPAIELEDALYVIGRNRMTCAGGTAGLDMMLQEIKNRNGKKLALEVADQLLYSPVRKADLPQREVQSRQQSSAPPALQKAIEIMRQHIEKPLTIPQIARLLGFSQRKLERMFNQHFECSAVAFYRTVRLQEARVLLTHTDMSVLDICIACGFASSSYFSKSYTNQFGVRPRDHRTSWPDTEANPYWPGINRFTAATRDDPDSKGNP